MRRSSSLRNDIAISPIQNCAPTEPKNNWLRFGAAICTASRNANFRLSIHKRRTNQRFASVASRVETSFPRRSICTVRATHSLRSAPILNILRHKYHAGQGRRNLFQFVCHFFRHDPRLSRSLPAFHVNAHELFFAWDSWRRFS